MPDINTEKVCYVVIKARELESEDEGVEADASNATDDKFVSVLTEGAFSTIRQEVGAFIDAMDEDEQCELVALTWVGRGDFSAEEWDAAVTQARSGPQAHARQCEYGADHVGTIMLDVGEQGVRRVQGGKGPG